MALPYHRVNNADDSTGKTWGFEGNNVFILLGALLLGISILSEGMSKGWSPVTVCVTGAAPVVIGSVWVFGFRQGKPPALRPRPPRHQALRHRLVGQLERATRTLLAPWH